MKIAIYYRHFPVAMGRYIHWGLEQAGHEVFSCGPYSNGTIPWGDYKYPKEYWHPPHIETPDVSGIPIDEVINSFHQQGIKPDLFISAADTYFLSGRPNIPHILIGTDPHVVDYSPYIGNAYFYVSMQNCYGNGAYWMPYAYDPELHYKASAKRKYDVVFCGLQYEHRQRALAQMQEHGLRVLNTLGLIYNEYREAYNQGAIAFNWSSANDLPARFWEGMAMGLCVLTNRVPDLKDIDAKEGTHYMAFDTLEEAVVKADWLRNHPADRIDIAENGRYWVKEHTYKNRVIKMLKDLL